MRGSHKKWISGTLCVGLAAFLISGCRSAQEIAMRSGNYKPAAQGASQSTPGANQSTTTKSVETPKAKLGQNKQLADEAEQAASETEQAASETEKAANSLVTGIEKEFGPDQYPSSNEIVNINYSSEERLLSLPGINDELAMRIIRNRPYDTPTDLIAKHVLTKEQYDRIKNRLTSWDNLWANPD